MATTNGPAQETPFWGANDGGERRVIPDVPLDRRPQDIDIPWSMLSTTGIALAMLAASVIAVVVADRIADRRRSRGPPSIVSRRRR